MSELEIYKGMVKKMKDDEIKEILDYFQKDVDKYEESKKYLMQKYGYDEKTIDNISQHERHINTKKLLDYITNLQQENQELNDSITWWTNRFNAVQRDYEDYKSRCENLLESKNKVLKYIKNYCGMELRYKDKDVEYRLLTIKDILNGRSDE